MERAGFYSQLQQGSKKYSRNVICVCIGDIPGNPTRNHSIGVTEICAQDLHPDGATTRVPFSTVPGRAQSKSRCRVFLINRITSAAFAPAASCTEGEHTEELIWAEEANDRGLLHSYVLDICRGRQRHVLSCGSPPNPPAPVSLEKGLRAVGAVVFSHNSLTSQSGHDSQRRSWKSSPRMVPGPLPASVLSVPTPSYPPDLTSAAHPPGRGTAS